ncbi:hypothetical protein A3B18_04100 [Candidatus Giovannonibacteria bacterium RIFCSPLOWO2_01_FULL_46_13]|uniref:HTH cro/C1-type domain-containing protein n=1 Tax=Candidatus Giovannonibacteria bacterium RIFCSPLOWO2_01_FULL_46_13 TaxID=1798352 RepID=A0A1F5X2S1_9BACT|nr:MAG: hypothetical protein A3B18_04100 [Candidatus Giovannonibacteria bacterium RIFCSPLOWO2_01_FULL_46_13]
MKKLKLIPFEKVKKDALKDPEVKKAYDDLELEFTLKAFMMQKRIDEGITQKELARRAKTKQSAISRFESGNYNPSLAWVNNLAHALNAEVRISLK